MPISLGLIGAGIWMQDAYAPVLHELGDGISVVAVHNRSLPKAEALAAQFGDDVIATDNLNVILENSAIEAVIIAVPIADLPAVAAAAMQAGKHVLSEKPVAPSTEQGLELLALEATRPDRVWMIGEQWRYEDAFVKASQMIQDGAIGMPQFAQWAVFNPFNPSSKYYATEWRRNGSFYGGIIFDAFIHRVAAFRMLLGDVDQISAIFTQHRPDIPPADTMAWAVHFYNGAVGSFSATYNSPARVIQPITVLGEEGMLTVDWFNLTYTPKGGDTESIAVEGGFGVLNQVKGFLNSIVTGEPHRSTAIEAVRDVAVMEAAFEAAEMGYRVAVEPIEGA